MSVCPFLYLSYMYEVVITVISRSGYIEEKSGYYSQVKRVNFTNYQRMRKSATLSSQFSQGQPLLSLLLCLSK